MQDVEHLEDHLAHELAHLYGPHFKTDVDHHIIWGDHHKAGDDKPEEIEDVYPRLSGPEAHDHEYVKHGYSHESHKVPPQPEYYY